MTHRNPARLPRTPFAGPLDPIYPVVGYRPVEVGFALDDPPEPPPLTTRPVMPATPFDPRNLVRMQPRRRPR